MLATVEHETGAMPRWSIIWLHGLGADGNDFAPIVPHLLKPDWPALRFVFPHAPVMPVTINGGMRMRAWYDILGTSLAGKQDAAGIRASVLEVEQLIARERERGTTADRIVLAGFSQGGAIALATAVRHPEPLAGVVALSAYLPLADSVKAERDPANRDLPVFMGHGSFDLTVSLTLGEASRDRLQALGCSVDWHAYLMAHAVSPEEIADLSRWLGRRFND